MSIFMIMLGGVGYDKTIYFGILIVLFIFLYEHFFIASTMEQAMDKQDDPGRHL